MHKFIHAFFDKKFIKFCLVGVVNTLFGMAVMYGAYNLLPWVSMGFAADSSWPYWLSSAANYLFGSILSYFLNKYFTFKAHGGGWKEVLRFSVNIAVCWLAAYGAAKPLVLHLMEGASAALRDNVAMLVGTVLFTALNYLGQRFFAFRDAESTENGGGTAKSGK